jgi:hypothetical protein
LAVTNDHFRPPIIVQNKRNRHAFDIYAFTIDLVPLVLEKSCSAGHIQIQVENIPKGANRRHKVEMHEGNKKRSPPTQPT